MQRGGRHDSRHQRRDVRQSAGASAADQATEAAPAGGRQVHVGQLLRERQEHTEGRRVRVHTGALHGTRQIVSSKKIIRFL